MDLSQVRKLVVFGDSYVEGQRKDPHLMITKYNPCYYLEKELGTEVINVGKFGSANQSIANEVFRYVEREDTTNVAFLVVWSDMKRVATLHPDMPIEETMNFDRWQYVSSIGLNRRKELEPHFREMNNPVFQRMWFEHAMHGVRMICQDYNIPLLMTNSIDTSCFQDKVWYAKRDRPIHYSLGKAREQWIEGDKPNNSMFDIITDRWLREDINDLTFDVKHTIIRNDYIKDTSKYPYLTDCFHPWDEGNELIAKTLAPYIKKIIEEDE